MKAKIAKSQEILRIDNHKPIKKHGKFFLILDDNKIILPYGYYPIQQNTPPFLLDKFRALNGKKITEKDIIQLGKIQDEYCKWEHWNFFYRCVNAMRPITFSFNIWQNRTKSKEEYSEYNRQNLSLEDMQKHLAFGWVQEAIREAKHYAIVRSDGVVFNDINKIHTNIQSLYYYKPIA